MALNINGGLILNSGSLNTIQTPRTSVVYDSGLIFSASVTNVELLGNTFSVTSSIITLDTADATYNRVDAIVAELSSSVGPRITKVTGTPSAEAAFPVLDPENQIALKYVTVKANAVTPSSAGTNPFDQETPEDYESIVIYNEGTGLPGEWTTGSTVVWGDIPGNTFQSTEEAYVGSYSIKNSIDDKPTGILRGQHIAPQFRYRIQDGNQIQLKRVAGFSFRIKLKKDLSASQPEFIGQIAESGGAYSQGSSLSQDRRLLTYYGVKLNDTTNWQYVTFSINDFGNKPYPSNPNNVITNLHLGVRPGRSITVIPDDAFVYIDDIRMHLGSLPVGDPDEGGNTGTTGGTGVYKQGDTNFSIIPTNALSCVTNDFSTVGGGQNNTITGSLYSYIGAGQNNIIESGSDYISILGGAYNTASADYSNVIGGCANINNGSYSSIAGGSNNCVGEQSNCSVIGGGYINKTLGCTSGTTIGGGISNTICGSTNSGHVIAGGTKNCACNTSTGGGHVSILGGCLNTGSGCFSSIVGGCLNINQSNFGFVGGGRNNILSGENDSNTIGGGAENGIETTLSKDFNTISGGQTNCISSNVENATIGGGASNCICRTDGNDFGSTIAGGDLNFISGSHASTIGGGCCNYINCANLATIAGGFLNTASADCSGILGGKNNYACETESFIIGSNLTSDKACYTFMNNLDVAGVVSGSTFSGSFVGDGSGLTNIPTSSIVNFPTEVSRSAAAAGFGSGGGGSSITLQDNGSSCTTALSLLNFVGATVTEPTADNVTVTFGAGLLESGDGTDTIQDVIGGHVVAAPSSSIVGGTKNTIACTNSDPNFGSFYNFIGGGFCNTISGSSFSTIIGSSRGLLTTGSDNNNAGPFDLLVGGQENIAGGGFSTTIGGSGNIARGCTSTVVGGLSNQALGKRSSILGGSNNTVINYGNCSGHSTIIGSRNSTIDTCYNNNTSIGEVIVGGCGNSITGSACLGAILGGSGHTVCHRRSAIIGGNTITTQEENTTYVENLHITSSYDQANYLSSILTLSRKETTPDSPLEGMIMASGSAGSSKLYYYDGSSWNALF